MSSNWLRNPIVSLLRIWPRCKRYFYGIQKYKSRRDSRVWYWPCKQLFEWLVYIVTWRACLKHAENETSIQFGRRPEEAQHPSHAKSFRYDLLGPDCTHVIIWMADNMCSYSIYPIKASSYWTWPLSYDVSRMKSTYKTAKSKWIDLIIILGCPPPKTNDLRYEEHYPACER